MIEKLVETRAISGESGYSHLNWEKDLGLKEKLKELIDAKIIALTSPEKETARIGGEL